MSKCHPAAAVAQNAGNGCILGAPSFKALQVSRLAEDPAGKINSTGKGNEVRPLPGYCLAKMHKQGST